MKRCLLIQCRLVETNSKEVLRTLRTSTYPASGAGFAFSGGEGKRPDHGTGVRRNGSQRTPSFGKWLTKRHGLLIGLSLFFCGLHAQDYTSYFTGNSIDVQPAAAGGVCLMGGASEDDNAMRWFLQRCNGGDVLVLRASGSDGYNAYLYSQLGVAINSVESIVCHNANASNDSYLHDRIRRAEGIWFAGGDQWNYVSYWRNTAIDSLVNEAIHQRNIVIGGTSAGMAIQGKYYFSAQNGTVTSATAMGNPYAPAVAVDSLPFLENEYLEDVITDTHYDNPDRRGRHVTFLARILTDGGRIAKGIACDEYTAVCIDTNGLARVFGDHPANDDNAYFIQPNCEIPGNAPEVCLPNLPLQWDQNGLALKVYAVKGTATGTHTFDLRDWKTGSGGSWEAWSVYSNALFVNPTTEINCGLVGMPQTITAGRLECWPNPGNGKELHLRLTNSSLLHVQVVDAIGQILVDAENESKSDGIMLALPQLAKGIYWVKVTGTQGQKSQMLVVQ